ncbi:MAG: AAA family ATPase [Candidatus Sedimenticola sp. 6PFRAG7]
MDISTFGFKTNPFSITPDPRFLYLSPGHEECLAHLLYGVGPNGGFVQVTGEVGTGKTLLIRKLLEQQVKGVEIAFIYNPKLSRRGFLAAICDEFRISYPRPVRSSKDLVDRLVAHLLKSHSQGKRSVILVDEAQALNPRVLETVRLLTNLETSRYKLLRIILVGQTELQEMMARPDLRQISQRVTARYHLRRLKLSETRTYIRHRLQVAGIWDRLFTPAATGLLHFIARGTPRLINSIGERALLGMFASNSGRVGAMTVLKAAREVLPARSILPSSKQLTVTASLLFGATLTMSAASFVGTADTPEKEARSKPAVSDIQTTPLVPPPEDQIAGTTESSGV